MVCGIRRDLRAPPDDPPGRALPGEAAPVAVGLYITAAYWFTASTSFANPAVTVARALTDTFAGIAPNYVAPFVAAQMLGALAGMATVRWLLSKPGQDLARPGPA